MANHYQSPEAVCPFYRMEEKNLIYCEGLTEGWGLVQECGTAKDAKQYKREYCRADWTECRIARMIWEQYDDPANLRFMTGAGNRSGLSGVALKELHLWQEFIRSIKGNRP